MNEEIIEKNLEQSEGNETQPELVPASECVDGQPISPSTDNGCPFPYSTGVYRYKLPEE